MERRSSGVELRQEGRRLVGPAIRYGDVSPSHRERFIRGAFPAATDDRTRWLNLDHDPYRALAWTGGGGLELRDTKQALEVHATLPRIPLADYALAQVRNGRLRGFSIEFMAQGERQVDGIRVIERADLVGVGLVENPSYQQSTVEVRRRKRRVRGKVPGGRGVGCMCCGRKAGKPKVRKAKFRSSAIDDMEADLAGLNEEMKKNVEAGLPVAGMARKEVIAGFENYSTPVASRNKGTLRGRRNKDGDLEVEIDLPDGPIGDMVQQASENAGIVIRPFLDIENSKGIITGDVMEYSGAAMRALLITATDDREGWPEAQIVVAGAAAKGMDDGEDRAAATHGGIAGWL